MHSPIFRCKNPSRLSRHPTKGRLVAEEEGKHIEGKRRERFRVRVCRRSRGYPSSYAFPAHPPNPCTYVSFIYSIAYVFQGSRMEKSENNEFAHKGESGDEMDDTVFSKRGCCFWVPWLRSDQSRTAGSVWWERIRAAEKEERWWCKGWNALKKVREWSEIVAGPKWKTFIRRFNKNRGCGGGCAGGGGGGLGRKQNKFQYDPLSYALNFDEGPGQNAHFDDDHGFRDFSSRYASIPISAKSSMDLGKDAPVFT